MCYWCQHDLPRPLRVKVDAIAHERGSSVSLPYKHNERDDIMDPVDRERRIEAHRERIEREQRKHG